MKKIISLTALMLFLTLSTSEVLAVDTAQSPTTTVKTSQSRKSLTPEQKKQLKEKRQQREDDINKRLKLTEAQKKQFVALRTATEAKQKPIHNQISTEMKKMRALKVANAPESQIDEQRAKIKSLRNALKETKIEHYKAVKKILTPAQQAEYDKIRKERQDNFDNRFKKQVKN